ncbi:MAG: class I SAM-dependent methyltransferase [Bacillota bacterium]|nr:class I SAM-dependent methyltransferase [Bacillota bacterium]MDW7678738.1 class I SAM-dependent methyltransferase [Bacillota bacterium]
MRRSPPFIHTLNETAGTQGIAHRVQGQVADMFRMPFAPESFDLIWSEGAIYIIGFQRGLQEWKALLKPGGALICSGRSICTASMAMSTATLFLS